MFGRYVSFYEWLTIQLLHFIYKNGWQYYIKNIGIFIEKIIYKISFVYKIKQSLDFPFRTQETTPCPAESDTAAQKPL